MMKPREQFKAITKAVAEVFGVPEEDLVGGKRSSPRTAEVRLIAMVLCYEWRGTTIEVGNWFRRNHSSVCKARQRVRDLCEVDPGIPGAMDEVRRKIQWMKGNL
jgi:chromosomal replication initiation ATPase DnaA